MPALNLLFILLILVFSVTAQLYYVKTSNTPTSSCPDGHSCLTLQQYARRNNFTSGIALLFLPGNHSLKESALNFTSLSNITLSGVTNSNSTATILFSNFITIQFENVTDLRIEGLVFRLNYTIKQYVHQTAALKLVSCRNVFIFNACFQGNGDINFSGVRPLVIVHSNAIINNCTFKRNTAGAVYVMDGTNLTICGSLFTRNRGRGGGGAIGASYSYVLLNGRIQNLFTHNADNYEGGAIQCHGCSLEMIDNNTFLNSSALYSRHYVAPSRGGALSISSQANIVLSGTVNFLNNMASLGGAIFIQGSTMVLNGSIMFQGNFARSDGGGIIIKYSTITMISGSLNFIGNIADGTGGAINIDNFDDGLKARKEMFVQSVLFMNNTAYYGGAVYAKLTRIKVRDADLISNVQSALSISKCDVNFSGTIRIIDNIGKVGGGIRAENCLLQFENDTIFDGNNSPEDGGALNCLQGKLIFLGITMFMHNSAGLDGGAIYAVGTVIQAQGMVNFTHNAARNGGAMYMDTGASLILQTDTESGWNNQLYTILNISYNTAHQYGGGIFYMDSPTSRQCYIAYSLDKHLKLPYCFIQPDPDFEYDGLSSIKIDSHMNSAGREGNFLYGGLLNRCRIGSGSWDNVYELYTDQEVLSISSQTEQGKEITSKPYSLCICTNEDTCHISKTKSIQVYRGEEFAVPVVAVTQAGTASTTVTAITSPNSKLEIYQTTQQLPDYCHFLFYNLYSTASHDQLLLYADGHCWDTGSAVVTINVTLLPCPDGFTQSGEVCICEERLQQHPVNCTIADSPYLTKEHNSQFWMGVIYTNNSYQGLVLSKSCPVNYCRTDTVNITLDSPEVQCDLNRSGLLCGGCTSNYSLTFGGSQCQDCSNTHLALLIPFAAAGVVLVAFLTFLRLTVATGTLNSVILYANILQVNRMIFIPVKTRNVLTICLAWLNLDLGFQTCFYDGMDAYVQTWLQFVFPLYVWVMITAIILISRHSIVVSKLIGHNPISVLATLLLMSYTKMLKIIIEVYSSTDLEYPDKIVTVWLKDANVPYLQSKHLVLTVATSLLLVLFFAPYTLLLLFGHRLYHLTGRKRWSWLNRIKPILDSYYGPYRMHTCFWTGLLLLIRCILYVIFLLNSVSMNKNLLAIVLTFTAIGFIMGSLYSGKIYKSFYVNVTEFSVYFNLIVLSAVTLAGLNSAILVYILISHVFIVLVLTCICQFHSLYIAKTTVWLRLKKKLKNHRKKFKQTNDDTGSDAPNTINSSHDPHKLITKTVIELREPLLDLQN